MSDNKTQKIGRVYKMYFRDQPDDLYIGSTLQTLAVRMQNHKHFAKTKVHLKTKWYEHMRTQDLNLLRIELLEEVKINNKQELLKVEDRYIRQLKPKFNTARAHLTEEDRKEYDKNHAKMYNAKTETKIRKRQHAKIYNAKPEVKEYKKVYAAKPEQKLKNKMRKKKNIDEKRYECIICGLVAKDSYNLKKHFNTKNHKNNITAQAINELEQLTEQNLFN